MEKSFVPSLHSNRMPDGVSYRLPLTGDDGELYQELMRERS